MRKLHTLVSFAIMIAITLVVLGMFRSHRSNRGETRFPASVSLYTETAGRVFLSI
ncbi:hypothetical protein [Sediminibacterium soli]|uniref:hypothetical protein n=1 Tax=Sediminibacterium soli TaxID=2698829 RepID=UPI00137B3142|nr:hypothetical protein [Sediminibacterium soli]NCI47679.1 hypothetical protein [Sediminibacterium soli]